MKTGRIIELLLFAVLAVAAIVPHVAESQEPEGEVVLIISLTFGATERKGTSSEILSAGILCERAKRQFLKAPNFPAHGGTHLYISCQPVESTTQFELLTTN